MSFKGKIREIAKGFPGLIEKERLNILNSQLIELKETGFNDLVNNFLGTNDPYTLLPFMFEIYICRWIHTIGNVRDICYEPTGNLKVPDFIFRINDTTFQIEAKTITQITNETVKKKIVKQINNHIASKTKNIIEIWLSEHIEPKQINPIVHWITNQAIRMTSGEKKEFSIDGYVIAWVSVVNRSEKYGAVGIEHLGGTSDGLVKKIDINGIREKIRSKMRIANKQFAGNENRESYNFLFLTADSRTFLNKAILQESIYGSEAIISYTNKNGEYKFKEILENNGIWSKRVFTNIDVAFFFRQGTDFLRSEFDPFIFPNHHNSRKLEKIPKPFCNMKPHYPPTMMGNRIFNLTG